MPRPLVMAFTVMVSLAAPFGAAAAGPVTTTYLYHLSSMTGVIPFSGARLAYDASNGELYVVGDAGLVRIFNASGMEVFTFGDSVDVGTITAVAAMEDGDIVALSYFDAKPALLRCSFRGERKATIELTGVPAEHASFIPVTIRYAAGNIYLADLAGMRFMVVDATGKFVRFVDVARLVQIEEEKRIDNGLKGFNVDREGNVLFTIPTLFKAFILSPSGELRSFGQRGGSPGKFNIVTGIAADENGYLYVADILKSVVIVFDKDLRFVREFGYRGMKASSLVSPMDVAAGNGKIFVSQYARRGVSVFQVAMH